MIVWRCGYCKRECEVGANTATYLCACGALFVVDGFKVIPLLSPNDYRAAWHAYKRPRQEWPHAH